MIPKKIKNLLKSIFEKHLHFSRQFKLSKRIAIAFSFAIGTITLVVLLNAITLITIRSSLYQINETRKDQKILSDFADTLTLAQTNANFAKRMVFGDMTLIASEENQLLSFVSTIKKDLPTIIQTIEKTAPSDLKAFSESTDNLLSSAQKWRKNKNPQNLHFLATYMKNTQLSMQIILSKVTFKMDKTIRKIENRINITLIFSILINAILISLLFTMVFPILKDMKTAFVPLHDASKNSLQGARESLSYATQITDAINQLQRVLYEMVLNITDVANNAQESSLQSSSIIQSVNIATELVNDLAEKANLTHHSLHSYQNNLKNKIVEIKKFTDEVNRSLETVHSNTDIAEKLTEQLGLLEQSIHQITNVLASVSDITDQTNLLALNASIEAARAGEYGRGFDVVAERIRALSDQTKKLTSEIHKSIKGIQFVSSEVAKTLTNVIASVRSSAKEVASVTTEIDQLDVVFESLYQSNEAIITAANLQLESTNRINLQTQEIMRSIQNISLQTQNVSAAMEELSASSEEINAQIQMIGAMVSETHQVIEKQVKLVELAKETTESI